MLLIYIHSHVNYISFLGNFVRHVTEQLWDYRYKSDTLSSAMTDSSYAATHTSQDQDGPPSQKLPKPEQFSTSDTVPQHGIHDADRDQDVDPSQQLGHAPLPEFLQGGGITTEEVLSLFVKTSDSSDSLFCDTGNSYSHTDQFSDLYIYQFHKSSVFLCRPGSSSYQNF